MIRSKALRLGGLAALAAAALLCAGAAGKRSAKEEIRFGVEAAQRGLWREAAFRWERALKTFPENARLRNNLAVAYESLGQFDRAREEYEQARRLDPENREIRDNYESFQTLTKSLGRSGAPPSAAAPADAGA
jgi:Flp pilus assembly protein TadD